MGNGFGRAWTNGTLIPARGAISGQINSIGEPQIEKGFSDVKKTNRFFKSMVILSI
jgi:hypothetical protein